LGQALSFDAVGSNNVNIESSSSLNLDNSDFSVSAWVKLNNAGSSQFIYEGDYGKPIVRLFGNKLGLIMRNASDTDYDSYSETNPLVTFQTWHFISVTYDGSHVNFYVDGVSDGSSVRTGIMGGSAPSGAVIGGRSHVYSDGSIDEVRIYNRALSPDEISDLYTLGQEKIGMSLTNKNTSGLVGMWSFDGPDVDMSTNTAYDRSGNSNNGTINGATPTIGKKGQALSFNGSSSRVDLKNSGFGSLVNNGDFTVSLWAKTNTDNSRRTIIGDWNSSGENESFAIEFGGYYQDPTHITTDIYSSSSPHYLDSNFVYSADTWYHIVVTRNSTERRIYIDGTSQNSDANVAISNGSNLTLGRAGAYNNFYLDGTIDEFRVYNRALSAQEVGDLYRLGSVKITN
jgi:hypothetical protein